MSIELSQSAGVIAEAVRDNISIAIFKLFEQPPLTSAASLVAIILVITFFVTSSDSGSLVIDIITLGGELEPPLWQRVFWAITEGIVAAVLLLAGGLTALQTASLAAALPFAVVMLLVCYGLLRGLRMEGLKRLAHAIPANPLAGASRPPWQKWLRTMVSHPGKQEVSAFLRTTVTAALTEATAELDINGLRAELDRSADHVSVTVYHGTAPDFVYGVHINGYFIPDYAFPEFTMGADAGREYYRAEVYLAEGNQHYSVMDFTKEQILADFVSQYEKHRHFLHLAC
jgi:choline/glycine/proline betaine transport protein